MLVNTHAIRPASLIRPRGFFGPASTLQRPRLSASAHWPHPPIRPGCDCTHTHTLRLLPPSGPASSCPAWSHSASKQKPCSALKISALCAPNNYLSLRPLFRRRRRRRGAPSSSRRHHVCCRPVTRPVSNAPRGAFRRLRLYLAGFVDLSLGKSLPRTLLRHSQLRASACRGHAAPPYTCPRPCYTRCYS